MVRGAGIEFVLACDMRVAARESAIFGQPEPVCGLPRRGSRSTPRAAAGVRSREAQDRIGAAFKRAFQTRDAEWTWARCSATLLAAERHQVMAAAIGRAASPVARRPALAFTP